MRRKQAISTDVTRRDLELAEEAIIVMVAGVDDV